MNEDNKNLDNGNDENNPNNQESQDSQDSQDNLEDLIFNAKIGDIFKGYNKPLNEDGKEEQMKEDKDKDKHEDIDKNKKDNDNNRKKNIDKDKKVERAKRFEELLKEANLAGFNNVEEYISDKYELEDLNKQIDDVLRKGKEFFKAMGSDENMFDEGELELEDDLTADFIDKITGDLQNFFEEKYKSGEYDNIEMPKFGIFDVSAYKEAGFNPKTNFQNQNTGGSGGQTKQKTKKPKRKKVLDIYGENLTEKALLGKLDKIVGRENEITRTIEILNRRSKNNPCLIGEPGVGKTAIAHGLAQKVAENKVPAKLLDKEIYLLDMAAVVAGTQYRGQFEQRMKAIIDECKHFKNIILVIDEIHSIVGTGDGENSTNAANILKPALSNGDVQVVGTTTLDEYRKYIEKDAALERRFQSVVVEEPSKEEAAKMIIGIKKYYEDYHKVIIPNHVIKSAVEMSDRYISERFLPDKAIDVIDEACSKINLMNKDFGELEKIKIALNKIEEEKEECVSSDSIEDYQKAADLKTKECALKEKMEEIEKRMKPVYLKALDVAKVIEQWTKIPVSKITEEENNKLMNLEKTLKETVIGQDEAVESVAKSIRRRRAGLQSLDKPPSFIFVGPTGVGKTQLAKSVAEAVYGSENKIIRVDMSEYTEQYSISKLIGAAPGYIGYDDAGQLTEKVRRNPYSIVLFDEIEKAHPEVFNLFLQILEDGRLTDSQGRVVNFANTIIIMTSNAGSDLNKNMIGFGDTNKQRKDMTLDALKQTFRPEFLNRVDEVIAFNSLEHDDLIKIIDIFISEIEELLKDRNITIKLNKKAKEYLLEKGTNVEFGARPLKRAIQKELTDKLTDKILEGKIQEGDNVNINRGKESLTFNVKTKVR